MSVKKDVKKLKKDVEKLKYDMVWIKVLQVATLAAVLSGVTSSWFK